MYQTLDTNDDKNVMFTGNLIDAFVSKELLYGNYRLQSTLNMLLSIWTEFLCYDGQK